jgi:hypothetical protein
MKALITRMVAAARRLGSWSVQIPGPYPMTVRRTALGAEVDVERLFKALLIELAKDSPDEDEELSAIRDASGPCLDRLLEDLIERLGGATVRLGVTGAHRFAEAVVAAAGPRILRFPQQRTTSGRAA